MTTKSKTKRSSKKGSPTTRIAFLVDESGSMGGQEAAVIDGMNEFVSSLLADRELTEDAKILASVGMFDRPGSSSVSQEVVRFKFQDQPLETVRELTLEDYSPRGGTPLNDAIAETIEMLGGASGSSDKVMIVVMTDGMENSSHTPSARVREMIASREESGWAFIYLGADLDAWAGSRDLGLSTHGKSFNVSKGARGVSSTMRSTASAAALYASSTPEEYSLTMNEASKKSRAEIPEDAAIDFAAEVRRAKGGSEEDETQ